MATNETDIPARPDDVWAVLVDAYAFPDWVVGARRIRAVEPEWPAPGAAFHHEVGAWPFRLKDNTKVRELVAPTRLVLEARARPAGVAVVTLTLEDRGAEGTHLVMTEKPCAGPATLVPGPVMDALTRTRNAESLRRLRNLVEQRRGVHSPPPG
ncbi:MAG TPA: SRPBCC domain-containing protein [Acidimicrobiales bacterium]|jgi:uncharacterized protein YndB with AHSA1/START domain